MSSADKTFTLIPLTKEIASQLQYLRERTGVSAEDLLKQVKDAPDGLNAAKVRNWMKLRVKTVSQEDLSYVLQEWQKLPQYEFVQIDQETQRSLQDQEKRTGVRPGQLVKSLGHSCSDGLDADEVRRWLKGTKRPVKKDYLDKVLSAWAALPDKSEHLIQLDDDTRAELIKSLHATGLSPNVLLRTRDDVPEGMTAQKIDRWLKGQKKLSIPKHFYDYLLKVFGEQVRSGRPLRPNNHHSSGYGSRGVPITESYIQELRQHIERTGITYGVLWKQCAAIQKPSKATVSKWLCGKATRASKDDMELVLSEYRKRPDKIPVEDAKHRLLSTKDGQVPISETDIQTMIRYRDMANILPGHIFKVAENVPDGLDMHIVSSWLYKRVKSAKPEHVKWVLETCKTTLQQALESK